MKKLLVSQQIGDGLRFKWITSLKPGEGLDMDGKEVGNAVFYVADILDNADGDIDSMLITLPFIWQCPILMYNPKLDMFTE